MSFTAESGYLPITVPQMMDIIMTNVNTQFGTTYTTETFLGTNYYKYFYALIQRLQENEVKTSEIFLRMQEYFNITNEKIQRPKTTHPGIFDYFDSLGYFVSTKPPADEDAGKVFICVDVDDGDPDYETVIRPAICNIIKDCVVAGVVSQGSEEEDLTLTNGQSMTFKFNLPDPIPIDLKLTITTSDNNEFTISSPDDIKELLYNNINARYKLGKNFEPQRYFSVVDAPWASQILLEYDPGDGFTDDVFESEYDEVLTFELGDISIVEE